MSFSTFLNSSSTGKPSQLDLFRAPPAPADPPTPATHRGAGEAERAAAAAIQPHASTLREDVFQEILRAGTSGRTNKELGRWYAARLKRPADDASSRYSVAPRCTELCTQGRIVDSGQIRERARVWVAVIPPGAGGLASTS
jgi:hypothetical protein